MRPGFSNLGAKKGLRTAFCLKAEREIQGHRRAAHQAAARRAYRNARAVAALFGGVKGLALGLASAFHVHAGECAAAAA